MDLQTFKNWSLKEGSVAKYNDGQFMGECVSLINQYCWRVLNVPADAWGHAADWPLNGNVKKYFDRVSDLKAGDILVYAGTSNNPYGHIEIYLGNGQSLFQNRNFDRRVGTGKVLTDYGFILRKKGEHMTTRAEAETLKNVMRVLNSEVKGWPRDRVHSGAFDEQEIKYLMGLDNNAVNAIAKYSQQAWDEGASIRKQRDESLAKIAKLEREVSANNKDKEAVESLYTRIGLFLNKILNRK